MEVQEKIVADEFDSVSVVLPGFEQEQLEYVCRFCGAQIVDDGANHWEVVSNGPDLPPCTDGHWPKQIPLDWANSAGISVDEEDDKVVLWISVGDPRGAFTFTVRRNPETGDLLLHLPYPGEPTPHEETERISDSTLRVVR